MFFSRRLSPKKEKKKKRKRINVIKSDSDDTDFDPSLSADADELHDTSQVAASSKIHHGNHNKTSKPSTGTLQKNKLGAFDMFSEGVAKTAKYQQGSKVTAASNHDLWGRRMPPEVLFKIFEFVVDVDGAVPFLCR